MSNKIMSANLHVINGNEDKRRQQIFDELRDKNFMVCYLDKDGYIDYLNFNMSSIEAIAAMEYTKNMILNGEE